MGNWEMGSLNLIPEPGYIQRTGDEEFLLSKLYKIVLARDCNNMDLESASLLQKEILEIIGITPGISKVIDLKKAKLADKSIIYLKREPGNSESYKMRISNERVEVIGADEAGLFYGVNTLRQIIRDCGNRLPALLINDEPYFKYRGYYHDVTRGKVPTLETLKELVDRISFYKLNQLQLYVEHSFAFEGMSEIWQGADPLTAEEILLLDEYCQKRHVELVPSLSTFGHLYQALSTSSYGHLAELEAGPGKKYSWIDRQIHHTLDVSNPESIEFVKSMLDQYIPLFSSNKFNICCDETFDLGEGKNKKLAAEVGKGRLYIDFLKKIIEHVKGYGKEVMFWGDIILEHPELMPELPDDLICLNWEYSGEPDEEKVRIVYEAGISQYLCPGVSGWNHLMNDLDKAFSNIEKMVSYGRKYGALGILNTDWGDYGHINFLGNSMPGMVFAAALSWNPETIERFPQIQDLAQRYRELDRKISIMELNDSEGEIVTLLRELARQQLINWADLVHWKEGKYKETSLEIDAEGLFSGISGKELLAAYNNSIQLADRILTIASKVGVKNKLDYQEFYVAAQGIALLNILVLFIKKNDLKEKGLDIPICACELASRLEYWLADFKNLWRKRNKESELKRIEEMISVLTGYLRAKGGIDCV
ncbi:MAG: glycoside hydrolase family 20 zincin-like fold domain-containing protein [Halanaerobiales bacterium]